MEKENRYSADKRSEWSRIIGLEISNRRYELNISQETLAERVGVRGPEISKYETGLVCPSAHRLFEIARALNCQMDVFYGPIKRQNLVTF